ncbi:MAG: hypothetical protein JWN46_419, partial [Acidimicrobiales bacterium]|nr:hypothetical protein [Acidimicrobiales bacterium]
MELDDRLRLSTPEGIDLDLIVVGLGSRFVAYLIDFAIQIGLMILLGVLVGLGNLGLAGLLVGAFLVVIASPVLFETFGNGRTPGKRITGLQVVTLDGRPVTFMASVIRNALRVIDALPGPYTVGIVAILASRYHQRVGDLAAGTVVVRAARPLDTAAFAAPAGAFSSP